MNAGTENRKKTIIAGALGAVALLAVFFEIFGGPSSTPSAPPPQAPVIKDATVAAPKVTSTSLSNTASARSANGSSSSPVPAGTAVAPGVAATKLASTSAGLDPTLDEEAMLRTESLVYAGFGRNIFSATYTAPPPVVPKNVPSARTKPAAPPVYVPPPPPPTCPPTCPPINMKFFGTARHADGRMQAFLLAGEDVYLANQGDIVVRKYKIVSIGPNSIRVEDMQNNNTQSLPLQQ